MRRLFRRSWVELEQARKRGFFPFGRLGSQREIRILGLCFLATLRLVLHLRRHFCDYRGFPAIGVLPGTTLCAFASGRRSCLLLTLLSARRSIGASAPSSISHSVLSSAGRLRPCAGTRIYGGPPSFFFLELP